MEKRTTTLLIIAVTGLLAIIVTAGIIYGTPLRYTDAIEPTIADVASTDFYEQYQANPDNYLFIDVRGTTAYQHGHAADSINIPLHMMYHQRESLPKDGKEIVLICSGGVASGVAYSYLEHYGFTNITRIGDGIEGWEDNGLPMEVSEIPEHDHSSH